MPLSEDWGLHMKKRGSRFTDCVRGRSLSELRGDVGLGRARDVDTAAGSWDAVAVQSSWGGGGCRYGCGFLGGWFTVIKIGNF